ncbi:alpha/beta hydrolase [Methylobacterium nodulans]|uniref:Alpha/beta hydrolase fold-3 domain protein n=1 Tax=Methylobacterium nodulans (strain LMG 21967 / CNCM I-2342 / ORS 2060) TaxID=460265 RepID=B8IMF7_METNO|nr:alpha/beta hydrolase [Methylobacterium nodulans]ACL58343.1 Alpha/beta hydrolase fold-3 domain protein [Methylobacterium nodulans ORS 2060]
MAAMHPDVVALVRAIREAGRPPFEALAPEEARAAYSAGRAALQPPPDPVAELRDLAAPGEAGPVQLRLYRGIGTESDAALPCLLYLHGGGWVLGDLDSHDGICRRLANAARACVIAVDYRRAPEHPFPAAIRDAAAALAHVAAEAEVLRIDPARLAVGGDSAGGNLAAVLALMGRDGSLPRSVFQMLLYPVIDLAMAGESYARVTDGVPITAATMRYFIDHYAPDAADRMDWRASPIRAPRFAGAPPALVLTCAHDPLCDEGLAYAKRLDREGVPVTALHLGDQMHGILTMGRAIGATAPVLDFVGAMLREAWRSAAGEPVP